MFNTYKNTRACVVCTNCFAANSHKRLVMAATRSARKYFLIKTPLPSTYEVLCYFAFKQYTFRHSRDGVTV